MKGDGDHLGLPGGQAPLPTGSMGDGGDPLPGQESNWGSNQKQAKG